MKNGKAPGQDQITEMLKKLSQKSTEILLHILNKAWEVERFPDE